MGGVFCAGLWVWWAGEGCARRRRPSSFFLCMPHTHALSIPHFLGTCLTYLSLLPIPLFFSPRARRRGRAWWRPWRRRATRSSTPGGCVSLLFCAACVFILILILILFVCVGGGVPRCSLLILLLVCCVFFGVCGVAPGLGVLLSLDLDSVVFGLLGCALHRGPTTTTTPTHTHPPHTSPTTHTPKVVNHLLGVQNSDALREAHQSVQPEVVGLFTRIGQSRPLYDAMVAIRETPAEWAKVSYILVCWFALVGFVVCMMYI